MRLIIVSALALMAVLQGPAHVARADAVETAPQGGESSGQVAISIVPADGKPRGIRLRSQTVSAVISEDASGVWADTKLDVQLQNNSKNPIVLPVGLPGPQVTAFQPAALDLPQGLEVSLDKKPIELYPSENAGQVAVRASTWITVPAQTTVALHLRYRQALPVRDGLAAYAYPLRAGAGWAGTPESLTVALTFAPPLADERVLHLTPGSAAPRPGSYRWAWMGVKAPTDVTAAFLTGSWWRGLEAARSAAAAEHAGLNEHAGLAELYWHMATLAPPEFAPGASFYGRTVLLAVAAWRDAIATAQPSTPKLDLSKAHERLAGIYLAEASRAQAADAPVYLQLAVNELAEAVALNPADEELASSARTLQASLAEAATHRGDGQAAAAHLARANALAVGLAAPAAEQAQQDRALALAETATRSGDMADARRLLQEAFGPDVLRLPNARPPRSTQSLIRIDSEPAGRRISVSFVDADQGASAGGLIEELADAWSNLAPVASSGAALTVTLSYTDAAALVAAQGRLAAALPRIPELAILSASLTSRRLAWPQEANLLARVLRYEERVDLRPSAAACYAEADKLEVAAVAATSAGANAGGGGSTDAGTATLKERLNALKARLWQADARAWRDLAALSRVTYRVQLQERGAGPEWLQARVHQFYREGSIEREWVVRAGEARQLEAAVVGWRYDRLAIAAGAAVLLAALVVAAIWLMAR